MIEAYCTRLSYQPGDTVGIHVSTDAERFTLSVGRDGARRTVVHEQSGLRGTEHGIPENVVEEGCGWPVAVSIEVPVDWQSGYYRLEVETPSGEIGEAFFILRAGHNKARMLWVIETNTGNAYNQFGGASTYTRDGHSYSGGANRVSFQRPMAKGLLSLPADHPRLAAVGISSSAEPPYIGWAAERGLTVWTGAAGWGQWDAAFVKWLDKEGIIVDYACSTDLENPDCLDGYKMLLCVGHDEYWSWPMRDTVETFIAAGGNAMFLTGNTSYWQVRLEKDRQQMVAYKAKVADDPVMGTADEARNTGIWSHRLTGRPENHMSGLSFARGGYARVAGATPSSAGGFTIYRPGHWALEGCDLHYGDMLGASHTLVGYECDGCVFQFIDGLPCPTGEDGTPVNFEIIGIAPATLWSRDTAPQGLYPPDELTDLEVNCLQLIGDRKPETLARFVHGHAVMGSYRSAAGGTVFSGGSTEWAFALADDQVSRIVKNVIAKLS